MRNSPHVRSSIPRIRIAGANDVPVRPEREFVLYWMIAFRRLHWNFALDRAVECARELKKPLVIFEALRCDYPWASDRLHRFVLDGVAEKIAAFSESKVIYYPYVEGSPRAGKGLLKALADRSCVVVTDDFPCFFLPAMVQAAARKICARLELVDSNGFLPLRAAGGVFSTAFAFRRFLQKNLPESLGDFPHRDPLARANLPSLRKSLAEITRRWPPATSAPLEDPGFLARLPINHKIKAAAARGGEAPARKVLHKFLKERLAHYGERRNEPEQEGMSGLSTYIHFGHISTHEIFWKLTKSKNWTSQNLVLRAIGSRTGWWGLSAAAEEFLDQLVTWRELGFNFSSMRPNYGQYDSLPGWARRTPFIPRV